MNIPAELKYTKDHEWVRFESDGTATVGITDAAQQLLGDIVYAELPAVGTALTAGKQAGTVESVKAVSEVFCPVSGKVSEVNDKLVNAPELLNQDPYGEWMFRMTEVSGGDLLTADEYKALL